MNICFCEEFCSQFNLEHSCCGSCHDGFDEGYSSLCEREINGITYQVCCKVLQKYDEKNENS